MLSVSIVNQWFERVYYSLGSSEEIVYFLSKNFFRKENIQVSSRRFFVCPEIAHDAQSSQVCIVVGALYITCVGCHRGLEAGGGRFKSRDRP